MECVRWPKKLANVLLISRFAQNAGCRGSFKAAQLTNYNFWLLLAQKRGYSQASQKKPLEPLGQFKIRAGQNFNLNLSVTQFFGAKDAVIRQDQRQIRTTGGGG